MGEERSGMRFGVIAAEKGFVTPDQLAEALKIQVEEDLAGYEHRKIGEILLELEYITLDQLNDILLTMSGQEG